MEVCYAEKKKESKLVQSRILTRCNECCELRFVPEKDDVRKR